MLCCVFLGGHPGPITEAYETMEQIRLERSISVRNERTTKRWRVLLRGVLIRARLAERYGDGIGEEERASIARAREALK